MGACKSYDAVHSDVDRANPSPKAQPETILDPMESRINEYAKNCREYCSKELAWRMAWETISAKRYPLDLLEKHKNSIDWVIVSRCQALDAAFIEKYKSRISFTMLGYNPHLSQSTVDAFIADICDGITRSKTYSISPIVASVMIARYLDSYKTDIILSCYRVPLEAITDAAIRKYPQKISQYQTLTEQFMEANKSVLDWNLLSKYQTLSIGFVERNLECIVWDALSYNKKLVPDVATKYRAKLQNTDEVRHALSQFVIRLQPLGKLKSV